MRSPRFRLAAGAVLIVCAAAVSVVAQQTRQPLPLEPLGASGEAIFPAFEGWGPHKDGSIVLLLGYYNRNKANAVDVPIGPNNRIEPGGPDLGQPTHFEPSRAHGVFAIRVPKDAAQQKYTWTLTVNGQTSAVSFWTNPQYWIDFFEHAANGNKPPVIRFSPDGPDLTGPPLGFAQTLTARVGQPLPLTLWASDAPVVRHGAEQELAALRARGNRAPAPPPAIVGGQVIGGGRGAGGGGAGEPDPDVTVVWKKHRAPGNVTFTPPQVPLHTKGDPKVFAEAKATATFDAPGEYIVRAQVNDESGDGGGGDQCCWTTALIRVSVK